MNCNFESAYTWLTLIVSILTVIIRIIKLFAPTDAA